AESSSETSEDSNAQSGEKSAKPASTESGRTSEKSSDQSSPKGPSSGTPESTTAATSSEEADANADGDEPSDEEDDDTDEPDAEDDDASAEADEEADDDEEKTGDGAGIVAVNSGGDGHVYVGSNDGENPPGWRLGISGYVRTLFTAIQNDPLVDYVGRHDGFNMLDARLKLDGQLDNGLGFQFELDGAVERTDGTVNSPVVDLVARLKDAFISYEPFDPLRVSVGQFKPPYDVEELTSNSELLFIHQSLGSRGVQNVEGFNVTGLSLDRQVGLRLDSAEPWYPMADGEDPEGPGFSYALAATNGNPARQNLNDNDKFAYYGRGAIHWSDWIQIGGAYFMNDKTIGQRPDRVGVKTTGWTADLTVDVAGVTAVGSIMEQTETPFGGNNQEGAVKARAYQGQIAYEEPFLGLQPAYRYAYYDPSQSYDSELGEGGFAGDRRVYHTFGLNYNAQDYPVRLMLNYTLTQEEKERALTNNRFDALLQLTW
ncbi:MAG: porin, partial [Bradymonadaceae bacterium]